MKTKHVWSVYIKYNVILVTYNMITIPGNTQPTPLAWPKGTYTLMKPFVGCPGSDVNWKEGSIYQDTEDDKRYSSYVISTNMSGMKY